MSAATSRAAKTPALAEPPEVANLEAAASGEVGFVFADELVTLHLSSGPALIALEQLTVEVIRQMVDTGRRGLAICGASKGVGVTFTAANLAVAVSQAGVPTLLIDANLHDPGVQRLIVPQGPVPGLSDFFASEDMHLGDVVQQEVLPNLSVLFAGQPMENAAEHIASERFHDLAATCLRDHVLTIIDTPPANRWAEARTATQVTGYAIIVARRNLSYVDDVITLSEELTVEGVNVLGKVLNGA